MTPRTLQLSMFGKFFDTAVVDSFAAWVVSELTKAVPPERIDDASKQTVKRREQVLERIRRHADSLVTSTRLNVYQKAKLGTRLQEALETAGYPPAFCKPFAYEVTSLVAIASSQRH